MEQAKTIPAVWVYTTNSAFNALRPEGYAAFLTDEQQARLERIRQARLLFDGKHREYFLDERRTQFDFPRVRVNGVIWQPYQTYNVLGLISLKGADLLFGQDPLVRIEDEVRQAAIDELADRCQLHSLLYSCAVDASYEGECFLEACREGGEVYVRQVPADEIFPVGDRMPDGQFRRYDRFTLTNIGTKEKAIWLLLETRYLEGSIERHLYQLDDNKRDRREIALDNWPLPEGADPLAPVLETGVEQNTIVWIPNLLVRGKPVSDYDGAIDLQDALNAKNTQVGRVLLKHSDPKMAVSRRMVDEEGNVRQDAEVFFVDDPKEAPGYIVWDAKLEPAMADRSFVLNQLLVRTETSAVLLGLKEGAAPDAYKKVRLEAFNSITKAGRKAAYWKAGIRRVVGVALDLELGAARTPAQRAGVDLRDGIPVDENEQANTIATLLPIHAMSVKRAVELQIPDPSAAADELDEIQKDVAAATPPVLMGTNTAGMPGAEPGEAGPAVGAASVDGSGVAA